MIKNYFKIAIKVLKRNKLYTFISLFGISFTLMILMLAAAILDNEVGSNAPLSKGDRILFVPTIIGEGFSKEKTVKYDTTEVNGIQKIDSVISQEVSKDVNFSSSSSLGVRIYKDYISKMKTPELSSFFIDYAPLDTYPDGEKLALMGNLVDANYWKIFDFQFIEGGPFNKTAVDNQANVVILRESVAEKYFGKQKSYLGKTLLWGSNGPFEVVGITKDVGTSNRSVKADFFAPITWGSKAYFEDESYFGACVVALLAKDNSEMSAMEQELKTLASNLELKDNFDRYRFLEKDKYDIYAWNFMGSQMKREGANFMKMVFGVLAFFLIIPLLNLINLNVTRIFERSAEIGVRKAFGAKTGDLLFQFLFENLIITFFGGLIGLVLTFLFMQYLNSSEIFGNSKLVFNYSLLGIFIFITFLFGLLSGFLPAWKISKTPVAGALKSGNL